MDPWGPPGSRGFGRKTMDELVDEELARLCQAVYRSRRARTRYMAAAGDLFADPIWDMMLDLYVASQRGQLTTVPNACVSADVPPHTGLRAIHKLDSPGPTVRSPPFTDKRMIGL